MKAPSRGETISVWHKNGTCIENEKVLIYRNGKLFNTKGKTELITITYQYE